ncbi:hypothetical protein F1880_008450 [Penicillium rolfsii]|nr:hypothetical protein F1880_008450 [Penicillium rolfsii]
MLIVHTSNAARCRKVCETLPIELRSPEVRIAMFQAVAYIIHRSPRCLVSQYLEISRNVTETRQRTLFCLYSKYHLMIFTENGCLQLTYSGIPEDVLRVQQNQKRGRHSTLEQSQNSSSEHNTGYYHPLRPSINTNRKRQGLLHNAPTRLADCTHLAQNSGPARTVEDAIYQKSVFQVSDRRFENWERCYSLFLHRYHNGQNPQSLYGNRLRYFTEARGMREKAGISQN